MNSHDYWVKREEEALKHYVTEEKEYDKRIKQIYQDQLDAIEKEIEAFYGRYAAKENITMAEAKKRVSKLDIEAYERKAKRYVEEAARDRKVNGGRTNHSGAYFSEKANEEMRLYNLTMKVNRLEMLKANIGLEMVKGHAELESFMGDVLKGRTEDELKRQAGILGKSIKNNAKTADAIVNASFHNATFSDRIWMNQALLKAELSKLLQSGMIQGKNPRALARELRKTMGSSTKDTERLMRTELARVQTEAQKQSFERNGFDEYEFIANGDCCDMCRPLNGKHFKVSKMQPGENAPPMHPNCRCSTAAYSDRAEYDAWLDFLDKGGSTAEWEKKRKNEMAMSTSAKWPTTGTKISKEDYKNIMQYATEKGIRLSGFKLFDGDINTIKELIDDANTMASFYPGIKEGKNKLTISLSQVMDDADFATTRDHIISINANAFRDKDRLAEEYRKEVEKGWFVKGTDYHSIIKHEIGHVVESKYGIDSVSIGMKCLGVKSKTELLSWIEENLSEYSAAYDDGSEIIAECFASAYGSENPIKFSLQFVEECSKILP